MISSTSIVPQNLQPSCRNLRLFIAGGSTGGHLFPGIAIARAFCKKISNGEVAFISAGNRFEKETLSRFGFHLFCIPAEGIKSRGIIHQLLAIIKIPRGIWSALRILSRKRPDLVLGVGGYASGPTVIAARLKGIPTAIHEQNILPGITNRILARHVNRVFISFRQSRKYLPLKKICFSGNPVRSEILKQPAHKLSRSHESFVILIIGGSQGAHAINMAMLEAIAHLKHPDRLRLIHQSGLKDSSLVKAAYQRCGVNAEVAPFFIDMASRYHQADLVICRSGATTVAEIAALGKAALFIPFPFAADDHQTLNAQSLVARGGAEMIAQKELDGDLLAKRITYWAGHREKLNKMAIRCGQMGTPQAADKILNECLQLLSCHGYVGKTTSGIARVNCKPTSPVKETGTKAKHYVS